MILLHPSLHHSIEIVVILRNMAIVSRYQGPKTHLNWLKWNSCLCYLLWKRINLVRFEASDELRNGDYCLVVDVCFTDLLGMEIALMKVVEKHGVIHELLLCLRSELRVCIDPR